MAEEYQSTNRINIDTDPRVPRELTRGSVTILSSDFSAQTTGYIAGATVTLDNIIYDKVLPDVRFVHYMDLSPPAGLEQFRYGPYTKIDDNGNVAVSVRCSVVNQSVPLPGKSAQGIDLSFVYYARSNSPSSQRDTANYNQTIYYVIYSNDLARLT